MALPASLTHALRHPRTIYPMAIGAAIRALLTRRPMPGGIPAITAVEVVTCRHGLTELRAVCGGVPHTITIRAERDALALEVEG